VDHTAFQFSGSAFKLERGASLYVIKKSREPGDHSPRWAAEPEKIMNNNNLNIAA
jgi:hypothetical protein